MKIKLNTKNLREQKNTTIISTEESLRDIEPYFNNNYKRRDSIMENFNINDLIAQLQEEEGTEQLTAEERANKIIQIDNSIKTLTKLLQDLFNRKAALEAEEEEYQKQQEIINQRYQDLFDIFSLKK